MNISVALSYGDHPALQYRVWFHHTGEEGAVEDDWMRTSQTRLYSINELLRTTEGHMVTHLVMEVDTQFLPDLHIMAPDLTHISLLLGSKADSDCLQR